MKKMFLLQAMTLFLLTAQSQINYGLKGGLNIANIGGSDIEDNKAKLGFFLGGFVDIPVQSSFSVQPELMFSAQGCGFEQTGDDIKLNMNYLLIPVMGKYTFSSGLFAETGPQLGFLLSAKEKYDDGSDNVKDAFKGTSFFWNFGLGYQPPAKKWGANVRFNLGLSRLDEDGDAQIFHRVFQFGVFYSLGEAVGAGGSNSKKK
jgi:hypothetical protein